MTFQADEPVGQLHGRWRPEQHAWALAHAAARALGPGSSFDTTRPAGFRLERAARLVRLPPDHPQAQLNWTPGHGWQCTAELAEGPRALLELYLPVCSGWAGAPITLGHLGQSLDGFIATPSGDSAFVTGPENILHLHRLRALCDAVVVGAGTVQSDNPRLTTRLVDGHNPARVVLDPACRLPAMRSVFCDREAITLRVCAAGAPNVPASSAGAEQRLEVPLRGEELDLSELLRQLHARGYFRVLIEGGGVTVSSFLRAGVLDRLHVAVAAVLIGEGRPALRLPPQRRLQDCLRLQPRVYRTGQDILFDCDLRRGSNGHGPASEPDHSIQRIL